MKKGGTFQGGLTGLIREAKKMQAKIGKIKKEMEEVDFTAESGDGMVKVTVSGGLEVKALEISEEAYGEDREMLNDLVISAINKAIKDAQKEKNNRMSGVTSGFAVPGLF